MSDVNRRDAVKLMTGLGVGMGLFAANEADGEESSKETPQFLENARKFPWNYRIVEQLSFKTSIDAPHLFFTSGKIPAYQLKGVRLLLGSIQLFLTEIEQDEFTKQGGLYWECGQTKGKVQFKQRGVFQQEGVMVLAIRDLAGVVDCYSMEIDFRCC